MVFAPGWARRCDRWCAPSPSSGCSRALRTLRTAEEQLEASALRRSEGRTREQLNAHLPSLPGLFACFGVPVVSAKGGAVSQLTFNIEQWNDLPQSESVPFEWW